MLNLSHVSGVLRLIGAFMLTVKTRELDVLIAGCVRVKHSNVKMHPCHHYTKTTLP